MFKKFRENWKNIDSSIIEPSLNFVKGYAVQKKSKQFLS